MADPAGPVTVLSDGHVLRGARPDDVDAIVQLEVAAFGASDEPAVRAHLTRPGGTDGWTVVEHRGHIVSTSALVEHRLRIDDTVVNAGQVEWVATLPGHRRAGLVRAQFARHHERAGERGLLVLIVSGIPYLYRRFGYGYGISWPGTWTLQPDRLRRSTTAAVRIRPATLDDVDALMGTDHHRRPRQVVVERTRASWELLVSYCSAAGPERLAVAEDRSGTLVGWVKSEHADVERQLWMLPSFVANTAVGRALVAHVAAELRPGWTLHLAGGPGAWGATVRRLGQRARYDHGIYTRVSDPVTLLDAMRPTLNARLASSEHHETGELDISLYRSTVRLVFDDGQIVAVGHGPMIEDPFAHGDVGVAPDWFGALVLGRWGASELAERCDDVTLGRYPALMEVLFPRLESDVACDL